ncbi:LacI family DNA-binding transcriptional regulator [Actibacterium sp. 188UL27-1]|nr:LacI family DNA-binding transcriptional regulator [Actibacterium sp. 188UL27-1]
MTASRVLRDEGGFSESTRDKVMAQVERLGYLPNRLATVFAGDKKSTFVGVSIPDLGNEVFGMVLEGIDRKLGAFSHQSVLGLTQHALDQEESWIETVLSWQPAGLILTGRSHTPKSLVMLKGAGVPVVEIWDLNSSPIDLCVGVNHFDSGYDMGRYLTGLGYRKLGYVGTSHDTANAATARMNGFTKAVQDADGQVTRHLCLHDVPGFYPGYYGTEQLLSSGAEIEAIFYQNDNMAVGGIHYCAARNLSVPGDIAIAGWGDLPILSILPYRVTTVHVSHLKLGQVAAEVLLASLDGTPTQDVHDIGFRLVPGATTGQVGRI